MAGDKTISIDLSLFSGGKSRANRSGGGSGNDGSGGSRHNKTLRKERKVRPKLSGPSPNSLRKNLLAKIKEHQQKENVESKRRHLLDDGNVNTSKNSNNKLTASASGSVSSLTHSGNTSYGSLDGDTFEDEFTRSLAYLSALAKSKENVRAEKKAKSKLKFKTGGIAVPLASSQSHSPYNKQQSLLHPLSRQDIPNSSLSTSHQTLKHIPDRPIGVENRHHNNGRNNVPEISLEMPPELDDTPKVEIQVLPGLQSQMKIARPNYYDQSQTQTQTLPKPQINIRNDPPYGVLKGGTKPTYRDFSRTQKNPSSHSLPQNSSQTIQKQSVRSVVSVNEHLARQNLERGKDKEKRPVPLVIPQSGSGASDDGKHKKQRKSKTIKRTTRTRHFKLGKDSKRRIISVFIKNNTTRRRIKLEIGQLKRVPIKDVKSYLRKHNLLKVGSSAPNDVLRHMYEQSVLSGDVNNLAKDTLIHNFLNDRQTE